MQLTLKDGIKPIVFHPITRILLGILLCFAILIGIQNFVSKPLIYSLISTKEIADTCINYLSVCTLLLTYYYLFRMYEQRDISELSLKYSIKEVAVGFILGFSLLSAVILILYLLGYYEVKQFFGYGYFLAPLSYLVVAALIEEVFFRVILYRILEEWQGTYIALLFISIAFEVPHWLNDNVSILSVVLGLLFGFAHGIMYTYTKRLWLPFAFHLGWNLAQPFYGSNLSGLQDVGKILDSKFEGPELLTGSIYGIEDSLLSILFLLIFCVVVFWLSFRDGKILLRKNL